MEDDEEFAALRQKRMAELQSQVGGGGPNPEKQQQDAERKRQMEETRQAMLSQLLTADARERLARVSMVKPEKAKAVEDMILRAGQSGQLAAKVDEKQLISFLEKLSEKKTETKITIQRRKYDEDD